MSPSTRPLERVVEAHVRVALHNEGVLVWKHRIDVCPTCGEKPKRGQGLGLGASDLVIVVPPLGRFLAIEMKRPGYSPSDVRKEQREWLAVVRKFGGVSGVASSSEEALALLKEARDVSA